MEHYPSGGKAVFLQEIQKTANRFVEIKARLAAIREVYDDLLYGPGVANEITEEDCRAAGFTQNDLTLFINFCAQFEEFMAGRPATNVDHNPIVNTIRTDL